jgi:hypothetical protein
MKEEERLHQRKLPKGKIIQKKVSSLGKNV